MALLSQLTEYFRAHELYQDEEASRKEKVLLDQAILNGAAKNYEPAASLGRSTSALVICGKDHLAGINKISAV